MTKQLTHPDWNQETGGLEVAKAFGQEIQGKHGKVSVSTSCSQLIKSQF